MITKDIKFIYVQCTVYYSSISRSTALASYHRSTDPTMYRFTGRLIYTSTDPSVYRFTNPLIYASTHLAIQLEQPIGLERS